MSEKQNPSGKEELEPSQGIELDAVDFSQFADRNASPRSSGFRKLPTASERPGDGWRRHIHLAVAMALLLMVVAAVFFWRYPQITLKFHSPRSANVTGSGRYVDVGPMNLSLGTDRHVKMGFKIACQDRQAQEELKKKGPLLRSRLVALLSSPEAESILQQRDYDRLRSFLKEGLADLLPADKQIEDVFFTEILVY